jgi:hypothetical protein
MTPLEALDRARVAWERSQPQLFLELWPDGGLDEVHCRRPTGVGASCGKGHGVHLVEPARVNPALSVAGAGGLKGGAEPCSEPPRG